MRRSTNPHLFTILSIVPSPSVVPPPLWTREPGVWALERAKQNVLENYLLVGILEERLQGLSKSVVPPEQLREMASLKVGTMRCFGGYS
jgi:hypothetical protein